MSKYEAPAITELGSVSDLTQGEGWRGDHDSMAFAFTIWGKDVNFEINYGQPPGS